jgi:hypothetical protein
MAGGQNLLYLLEAFVYTQQIACWHMDDFIYLFIYLFMAYLIILPASRTRQPTVRINENAWQIMLKNS